MKLLSTQSSPASCHCLCLTIQYHYHNFENKRVQAMLMKCKGYNANYVGTFFIFYFVLYFRTVYHIQKLFNGK